MVCILPTPKIKAFYVMATIREEPKGDGANHLKIIPILVRLQLLRQPLMNSIEDNC
jgi:hypothetical protein